MPTDRCLWLDDLPRIQHMWGQTVNPDKHQAINVAEVHTLRRSTPQHVELIPQQNDFGPQRSLRPEQPITAHQINLQKSLIGRKYHPICSYASAILSLR